MKAKYLKYVACPECGSALALSIGEKPDDGRIKSGDMLSPAYDFPQTLETVRQWFADDHYENIDVHYGYNGIEGRGVKPRSFSGSE